jgi:acetolactate synthase-like protein
MTPDISLPTLDDYRRSRDVAGPIRDVAERLKRAERPVLVVGSQALVNQPRPEVLADAVRELGVPTFLAGSARGLLGRHSDIQFRHKRSKALKEADLVIVAGFPFDFRLNYGRSIGRKATLVAANLSSEDLKKNRRPDIALQIHPGSFLQDLSRVVGGGTKTGAWEPWFEVLRGREQEREDEITRMAAEPSELVNPLHFFRRLEDKMDDDAVLVVDGGDFVATASYIVRPRRPLNWLDPGVFGTLGVGGGFAVGAALCRPGSEVWLIYGDGSCAYSVSEFDTCVRHGLAPIALVGTDGAWAQIAREQTEMLGDDVGTVLLRSDYHKVAEGYGGVGLLLTDPSKVDEVLDEAKALAKQGKPVLVNVHIGGSDFRKGSISM